jgi:hypothetical protein
VEPSASLAKTHQLSDPASILAVGLHRHDLEGGAHMAGLQQFNRQTGLLHSGIQPLR